MSHYASLKGTTEFQGQPAFPQKIFLCRRYLQRVLHCLQTVLRKQAQHLGRSYQQSLGDCMVSWPHSAQACVEHHVAGHTLWHHWTPVECQPPFFSPPQIHHRKGEQECGGLHFRGRWNCADHRMSHQPTNLWLTCERSEYILLEPAEARI